MVYRRFRSCEICHRRLFMIIDVVGKKHKHGIIIECYKCGARYIHSIEFSFVRYTIENARKSAYNRMVEKNVQLPVNNKRALI